MLFPYFIVVVCIFGVDLSFYYSEAFLKTPSFQLIQQISKSGVRIASKSCLDHEALNDPRTNL